MTPELKDLKTLIQEGRNDEAKKVLEEYLTTPFDEMGRGETFVAFASLYLEVTESVNDAYIQALESAVADLKKIDATKA